MAMPGSLASGAGVAHDAVVLHRPGEALMSDRREFLQQSAAITAAALTAGYTTTSRGFAANDTLNVGCIGTGGRCKGLMSALAKIQGVRITAVCDVWDVGLNEGKQLADPKAFTTKYHEELLARKDVDA